MWTPEPIPASGDSHSTAWFPYWFADVTDRAVGTDRATIVVTILAWDQWTNEGRKSLLGWVHLWEIYQQGAEQNNWSLSAIVAMRGGFKATEDKTSHTMVVDEGSWFIPGLHADVGDRIWSTSGALARMGIDLRFVNQIEEISPKADDTGFCQTAIKCGQNKAAMRGNRGPGQTTPARVTAVTCADSVPVSITGTGGTVSRASTSGSGSLTSLQTVPSGTWDTVVAISPSGISFNTSTGVWSIAKSGWYHVDCRAWLSANVGTKYYNLILQKNGSNIAAGPISVGSSDSYSPDAITGSWTEYFSAGDTMSMAAYNGGGSSQIVGGPGLDNTRWSVALVSG